MRKIIIVFVVMITCFVNQGFTQNEAFFLGTSSGIGGRALSMGSAYTAIADDYSATMWNPAGLTQLRRMELFTSFLNLNYKNSISGYDISNTDETSKTKLNSIGFAFPIPTYRGSMVFAVGYNKVRNFDGGFSFAGMDPTPDVQAFRNYNEVEEGDMANWVFAGAVQVTPALSVGASLNLWRGEDTYNWALIEEDKKDVWTFDTFEYVQNITTNFSATNLKVGVFYQLGNMGRMAATIATPVKINAKEKWSEYSEQIEDADSPYYDSEDSNNGSWDYGVKSSYEFTVGAALTMLPNIVLSADIEYSDWSQMRYTSEPPAGNKYRSNLNFKENFEATSTYRVGGEFTIPFINTQLRAGMIHQPSPYKLASEDADRKYYTFGLGVLLDKQVKLDLAYVRGSWKNEGVYLSDYFSSLTEDIEVDKIFATMSIRF